MEISLCAKKGTSYRLFVSICGNNHHKGSCSDFEIELNIINTLIRVEISISARNPCVFVRKSSKNKEKLYEFERRILNRG